MPYFVKWTIATLAGQDEIGEQPISYAALPDAKDFACAILGRNPTDIWLEDESGKPVVLDVRIRQHCRAKGRA